MTQQLIEKFENDFTNGTIRYGDMKEQLGNDMVAFIAPIREKAAAILANEKYLKEVMEMGAAKARKSAVATMEAVRTAMGLNYF